MVDWPEGSADRLLDLLYLEESGCTEIDAGHLGNYAQAVLEQGEERAQADPYFREVVDHLRIGCVKHDELFRELLELPYPDGK